AGEPAVNLYQGSAIPSAFVFKLALDLSPTRIGDMPCKSGVLNHVFYFQVFDADYIEVSYQSGGQLVRLVLALIPDFRVSLGDSQPLTFSPLAAFLFTAQGALLLFQVPQSCVVFLGVLYFLAVA